MLQFDVQQYPTELAAARSRLLQYKNRFRDRARLLKGELTEKDLQANQRQNGSAAAGPAGEETPSVNLQQIIARCLLDASTQTPIDSLAVQKKLAKGETAAQLEDAIRTGGESCIEQALREMGQGDLPALEAEDYDMHGKQRVMVLGINRARLTALAGLDAPASAPGAPPNLPGPPPLAPPPQGPPGGPGGGPPRPPGGMPMQGMPMMSGMPFGPHPGGPPFNPQQGGGFGMPGPGGFHQGPPPFSGPGPNMMAPQGGMPMGMGHMGAMGPRPGMMGPPPGMMGPPGMPPPGMPMQGFGGPPHGPPGGPPQGGPGPPQGGPPQGPPRDDLDELLNRQSIRAREKLEKGEELLELLQKPTARESAVVEKFRSEGGPVVREFCPHLTKDDCCTAHMAPFACPRIHFKRVIFPWTDMSLGNCSYLDTCRHLRHCRYVHYELDDQPVIMSPEGVGKGPNKPPVPAYLAALPEPQWLKVDIRSFDMSVLGKFGVIMADPPWEIHQDLPYGTMADVEMRQMKIGDLQDDGVIFLWVTGRAMELGRECLEIWGYKRVDELIWVKTNQLQRLIRTGRTGHWLNHSKEHCLVGIKGNPSLNRNLECDVLVAEVRETSRKPDEMYSLLERISPGTRKVEIFARNHNLKPGWVSLGNQLPGIKIVDPDMLARYEKVYGPIPEEDLAAAAKFDINSIK